MTLADGPAPRALAGTPGSSQEAAREAAARRLAAALERGRALDRLAGLTARLVGVPVVEVLLVTDRPALVGTARTCEEDPEPRTGAVARRVVTAGAPVVVEDVRTDRLGGPADVGAFLGVPLRDDEGHPVGALVAGQPGPRHWTPDEVDVLGQLAESAVAELELAALAVDYETSQVRLSLALDAAGIGSFDWDLRTGVLVWDERMLELFGYAPGTFSGTIDAFHARVHPDDLTRVTSDLQTTMAECGTYHLEYRVVLPDDRTRWVTARGRALCEGRRVERLIGAAYDSTATREGEARVTRVLESMSAAFYSLDHDWRFTYVNAEAERLLGRTREELLGGELWELFPETVGTAFEANYRAAVASGRPVAFEAYYPAPLEGWYELRAWPNPDGLAVYFLDITQRRAAQERAERLAARTALLARVTSELTAVLDSVTAVGRLAQLVVPTLADWCLVTLVDEDGRLREVGSWHRDEDQRELVQRYADLRLAALSERSFVAQAMRTGQPALVPERATERISDVLEPGEARDLLLTLAPEAAAVLPLRARGRTVGLLSVFNGPDRGGLDPEDVATVREVVARAALALDNARLFEQQRRLAEELQRSLLTPPPQPGHAEIVVRYQPAAAVAQVGGDWYDAFLQPDGGTVLVIGDVVGHDTAAAAAMGQVRGLLRGIAFTSQEGPAQVLSRLDAALEGLQVGTTATAVVARLEQTPEQREQGLTRIRWSNAGHPPPLVLGADGTVRTLATEPDLLLGIDPSSPRTESVAVLERGATVLLYTDGLVERRGQSLDDGLDRLRETLATLHGLPVAVACDQVLSRLLPASAEDDVALVAVRLHAQDRPRPAEAGPRDVSPLVPAEDER